MSDPIAAGERLAALDVGVDPAGDRAGDERQLVIAEVDPDAFVSFGLLRERREVPPGAVFDRPDDAVVGRAVDVHVGDVHEHRDADAVALLTDHRHPAVGGSDDARGGRRAPGVAVEPKRYDGGEKAADGERRAHERRHDREDERDACEPPRTGGDGRARGESGEGR